MKNSQLLLNQSKLKGKITRSKYLKTEFNDKI